MHETSDFFYFIITFSYTKYFVHSYTVDVVFTLFLIWIGNLFTIEKSSPAVVLSI